MTEMPTDSLASLPQISPASRAEWRAWLAANHQQPGSVWLVLPKKGSGLAGVAYSDAVDEALCFGWVDSLPRKLDEARSLILMSPRKATSNWSAVNKAKVARLVEAGLMAPAGLAMVATAKANGAWDALDGVEALEVPADLANAFSHEARAHWDAFPRSAKRGILEWIHNAKTAETRARRIAETAAKAALNERANQWRG
jgi:uncharacterized protein YdeI (YjbR/CyaY-like superfamily)